MPGSLLSHAAWEAVWMAFWVFIGGSNFGSQPRQFPKSVLLGILRGRPLQLK